MSVPFASEFSFNFKSSIWELHHWNELLLVTTKDQEQLQTTFHLIDTVKEEVIFQDISFEESWWISVFLFNGRQIVFQVYNDTQDIEHRTAFCFDLSSEEVLWSVEGVKLQQINASTIRCTGLGDEADSFLMNVSTGESIDRPALEEASAKVFFPQTYGSENEYYPLLSSFLDKRKVVDFVEPIEYLEYQNWIVFGLNFHHEHTYSLKLFVYEAVEGELLFEKVLDDKMDGHALGAFFILEQALIFVEEKHRLKICSLN